MTDNFFNSDSIQAHTLYLINLIMYSDNQHDFEDCDQRYARLSAGTMLLDNLLFFNLLEYALESADKVQVEYAVLLLTNLVAQGYDNTHLVLKKMHTNLVDLISRSWSEIGPKHPDLN